MPNIFQPSLSNTPSARSTSENATVTPYATDLLQRGQAFTTAETPTYSGQLTTGPSKYQTQSWQGLANLALPENSKFGTEQAQQYMNPYIQQALDPQLDYMRRQAQINQQNDLAKLTGAGAFGGSRQAVLQGLNQEALMRQQAATTGAGYEKAYNAAMAQFNADQGNQRSNLNALSTAGGTQQEQEQAALDASYKDWLRQTKYPGEQLEQQKGIITAMAGVTPQTKTLYEAKDPAAQTIASGITMGKDLLGALGIKPSDLPEMARKYGVSPEQLKSIFGISVNPTGSVRNETDLSKLPPEDLQKLYEQENPGGVDLQKLYEQENPGSDGSYYPAVMPENEYYDYGNDHAKGGLIDLLHKMRSHK